MSIRTFSGSTIAVLFAATIYALPASALTCPPGEAPRGAPEQCVKRGEAKPQLDLGKYSGAEKAQAEACNKVNAAHAAITDAGNEIARLNTSINAAQHEASNAPKGEAKDAAKAKVAELKAKRKAEEQKLNQARADESAGKKEHRKAVRLLKKEGGTPLQCL